MCFDVRDQLLIIFFLHLSDTGDFKKAYDAVRREVFCSLLIEFETPMKLVRLIRMYNYCVSGHCPSSCLYLRHTAFWRLDSVFVFRWNLLSWTQLIKLVSVSACQQ
jgi:hypothetical protein